MPRRVLVKSKDEAFDLVEVPAPNEKHLQEIMKGRPTLVPAEDLGYDDDLLVVGRETTLASGAIDLLCLASSGSLVLIEFKTGPQNPDFRHALAQLIDYGSDLWQMTLTDFDQGVVQRFLASSYCDPAYKSATSLRELVEGTAWALDDDGWDQLQDRLKHVLEVGDFDFVVAAQRFTPAMLSSLDYLNATTRYGRYFLLQLVQLAGSDLEAYSAQMVGKPSQATSGTTNGPKAGQVKEAEFLESLSDEGYRSAVADILSAIRALGLTIGWGSKGTAFRIQTEDRAEPLSIGWAFPEGTGWAGVRHLSLGVDQASASKTPSITNQLHAYLAQVHSIPAGVPIKSQTVEGRIFAPEHVPAVKGDIIRTIENLVASIKGERKDD